MQNSPEKKQLKLLDFIEINCCESFDFLNETTLVAVAYLDECIYKFTRADQSSHEFKKYGETKIKNP